MLAKILAFYLVIKYSVKLIQSIKEYKNRKEVK